jgi:hypothetical protein
MRRLRTAGRRWSAGIVGSALAAGVLLAASPAGAAPAGDTTVTVRGAGTSPGAVIVAWVAPSDPSYAGTRVVVVRGDTAPTNPDDPAAVATIDAPSPSTSATVVGLAGGQDYTASAFSYDASQSYAPGASVSWTEPGPPTTLSATGDDAGLGGVIHLAFDIPATADREIVCVAQGQAPPAAPAAPARCGTNNAGDVLVTAGQTYGVAVFGWSATL